MRTLLKMITIVGCLFAYANASEKEFHTFTGGNTSGMYYKQSQVMAKYLAEEGVSTKVYSSEGGKQNGRRIAQGINDFGLIQKDTHILMQTSDSLYSENVNVLGKLNDEAVLFVVSKRGRVKSDSDLKRHNVKIAVLSKSSGANSSYSFMSRLVPEYQKNQRNIVVRSYKQALRELKLGMIDAIMFVQSMTNLNNDNIKKVLKDEDIKFMNLTNWALDDRLGGNRIYESCSFVVGEGWIFKKKVKTICTEAVVIVNKDVPEVVQDKLYNIIERKRERIVKGFL